MHLRRRFRQVVPLQFALAAVWILAANLAHADTQRSAAVPRLAQRTPGGRR